jgi:hypothetical protein
MTINAVESLGIVKLLISFNIYRFTPKTGYFRPISESTESRPGPIKNIAVNAAR